MLMNTTFLGDSFSIKWQSRVEEPHPFFFEYTRKSGWVFTIYSFMRLS